MGNQQNSKQPILNIKVISAETQSLELFDFHSQEKQQQISTELQFPSCIAYSQNSGGIVYMPEEQITETQQQLYRIDLKNYRQIRIQEMFDRDETGFEEFQIWKVLNLGEQYMLEAGDILKIGKTKIQFREIISNEDKGRICVDRDDTERMDNTLNNIETVKTGDEYQCRFCFQSTESTQNPLLSVCKCSGSVKYIHFQCLKDWVSNNVKHEKSQNFLFYSYYDNKCQLCKHPIENQFTYDNRKYTLFQFQKIQSPYAVFQNRVFEEESGKMRISVYLISLNTKSEITVGRNNNSKVVLKDISVSRNHCSFYYRHGKLLIEDRKSKFGTLVSPKKGFYFDSVSGLELQFQSKLIRIQRQNTLNGCCCTDSNSYFVQIKKNQSQKQASS